MTQSGGLRVLAQPGGERICSRGARARLAASIALAASAARSCASSNDLHDERVIAAVSGSEAWRLPRRIDADLRDAVTHVVQRKRALEDHRRSDRDAHGGADVNARRSGCEATTGRRAGAADDHIVKAVAIDVSSPGDAVADESVDRAAA